MKLQTPPCKKKRKYTGTKTTTTNWNADYSSTPTI